MDIVRVLAELDEISELHEVRLLLLLNAFAGDDGEGMIEGLTKLAKLDFLLRYPIMLERALEARNASTRAVQLEDHERQSVESQMVRYRFGPWDHRYREWLNSLVARDLVRVSVEGRKITIAMTQGGRELAVKLEDDHRFTTYASRATLLKRHFDLTATNLMRFIYETFPEVISLRSNAPITI